MRFLLGCLGVVFVVFGGCVSVAGMLALPSASDTGFLVFALAMGVGIFVAGGLGALPSAHHAPAPGSSAAALTSFAAGAQALASRAWMGDPGAVSAAFDWCSPR